MATRSQESGNLTKARKGILLFPHEQVEAVVAVLKRLIYDIVKFARYSVMRKGNILNLRIEQVEFHPH
jgi:hypothetical protein